MKAQYISELLFSHECVIVPGLGGFISSYKPAWINRETNTFFPPSCNIAFNESLSANDGLLASHISKQSGSSYRDAVEEIHKWVEESMKVLNTGGKLVLEEIGTLELNADRNLQFEPHIRLNFLGDSYGLPILTIHPLLRKDKAIPEEKTERVQAWPSKLKYIIPATLKWAAVLAPFIAFTIWGSNNTRIIGNYVQNYSGLFSWVRVTPGKISPVAHSPIRPSQTVQGLWMPESSPAGIMNQLHIEYAPATVSYQAMMSNGLIQPSASKPAHAEIKPVSEEYFIIGGAFREHSNATKMLNELKAKGFPATIIDTTGSGLFVVSIQGFEARSEASSQLPVIKEAGYSGAWIMRKSL